MPLLRLTKANIDRLEPVTKPTYFFDTDLTGFFLRATPTGARAFGVEYRAGSGRGAPKRRITIGGYGKLTPDEARKEARKLIGAAAVGDDPAAQKAAKAKQMTVADLVNLYEAEGCFVQAGQRQGEAMKPMTKRYTLARLRHHVVPLLGPLKAAELSVGDVERFYRDVAAGRTASDNKIGPRRRIIVRGGEGAARKVFRDLSAVCSFAENRGIMARNICRIANVRRADNVCERFLELNEIEGLAGALDALLKEGANPKAVQITFLWLFTGCRRNEIAALEWSEVELLKNELLLSDSKTGRSWRPMAPEAAQVLRSIHPDPESRYVFPAERGDGHFQGTDRILKRAIQHAGLIGVTPHILRHTMGSHAVSAGLSLPLVGAILGHANPRSTQRYAHVQRHPAQEAAASAVRAFGHVAPVRGDQRPQ